jgi:glutathionylspermidine synthase
MQRIALTPRPGWQSKVESVGLTYHSPAPMAPRTYWDESACYRFSAAEVDTLEAAANELQRMCLAAAQVVIDRQRYAELAIPPEAIRMIEWAWNQEPPALYGRFDIAWAGEGSAPPKLLEYNADTPTSLLEAAVVQWHWLEDVGRSLPGTGSFTAKPDQFNSLHERLIAKWKDVADYLTQPVFFASLDEPEDHLTIAYLQDTATQAGLATRRIAMHDIGWNAARDSFVDIDPAETRIDTLFKLYPWESMLREEFAPHALEIYQTMTWIEPIWKLLLSNKGILPILWELYPNHPNLLEAHFDGPHAMPAYVRKPIYSREGANIRLVRQGAPPIVTDGPYGDGPVIFQALAPDCVFPDESTRTPRYPVLGLWMIDQECGGLGIRESLGPITDNLSSFIPHYFA